MYAVMRSYTIESGDMQTLERRVSDSFIPLLREAAGFHDYYFVRTGPDTFTTISLFEGLDNAQASVRLAAEWVKRNLRDLDIGVPEVRIGRVSCEGHRVMFGEAPTETIGVPAAH